MAGIAVTRTELTAGALRGAAAKTKDARAARRMLAIALVLEDEPSSRHRFERRWRMIARRRRRPVGWTARHFVSEEDQETVRGTVSPTNGHRTNAEGLGGLENRKGTHRPRRLVPEQLAKLAAWVEAGPDPVRDGVVRWRCRDLQARIAAEFGVVLHERTVGKQLAALGFRRLQVAPAAPEIGRASTSGVQKNFPEAGAAAIPETAQAKPLEIWFQGEPGQKTVRGMVFPANAGPENRPGDGFPGERRARKPSGGRFSRRTRGLASKAPSPASGPNAAPDPGPSATPALNGATFSARSALAAPSPQVWYCPSPTPTR